MKIEVNSDNQIIVTDGFKVIETINKSDDGEWNREPTKNGIIDFFHVIGNVELKNLPDKISMADIISHDGNSYYGFSSASIKINSNKIYVSVGFTYELRTWDNSFTANTFFDNLKIELGKHDIDIDIYYDASSIVDVFANELQFEYKPELTIKELLSGVVGKIKNIERNITVKLLEESSPQVFKKIFDFPERYSVICTQYVVWFGELLKKLGVSASISTRQDTLGLLLSIKHDGGQELTDRIEQLLYGYLSLPYSEYLPNQLPAEPEVKMELLQLRNQVDQFKFNLLQAKSALEIQSLKSEAQAIELKKKEDELVLLRSSQNSNLELFDGALAIEKFKILGVTVNPKKVYELLK
ncbi:hypothetical protein QXB73_002860 [Vibrio fluvialis]|uniref:hypothetical protein n=1 Tax=Vibrio fluvialis TaxID=676 RepID=UPI001558DE54|nr:hypothetical protein [Vibrio fluvialis]ELO1779713.1 hypothetical protein [Vibrio fluvialis]